MKYFTPKHFEFILKTTLLFTALTWLPNSHAGESASEKFRLLLAPPGTAANLANPVATPFPLDLKMLPVYASSDMRFLLGGMTELIPDSGIFITARHIFQNLADTEKDPESFLAASLNVKRDELKNFRFFGFLSNSTQKQLDAILIVPHGKEELILSNKMLKFQSHFELTPSDSMPYFSRQFGSLGGDAVEQKSAGFIEGKIGAVSSNHSILSGDDYFYLPGFGLLEVSSHGSSGALVQTQEKSTSAWNIAGIVQCQLKNSGMIRVLSLRALSFATLEEIANPFDLLKEPSFIWEDGCMILSRRDGGG